MRARTSSQIQLTHHCEGRGRRWNGDCLYYSQFACMSLIQQYVCVCVVSVLHVAAQLLAFICNDISVAVGSILAALYLLLNPTAFT